MQGDCIGYTRRLHRLWSALLFGRVFGRIETGIFAVKAEFSAVVLTEALSEARLSRILMRKGRCGLQTAVFGRAESHLTQAKHPESFAHGGEPVPPPIKVNSLADQGTFAHADTLKSSCGQTDFACGQIVSPCGQSCVLASILCLVDANTHHS